MANPARRRNARGSGALLRDEILAAAKRVVDEVQTAAEVSLRSIAREAGIAAPSVYAHFDDRDQVLEAVAELSWSEVCDEIAQGTALGRTARDKLLRGSKAYVAFAERHPLRYALMAEHANSCPSSQRAIEVVTRGLLACASDERRRPRKASSDRIAASLSVAIHGVAMLHRTEAPHLWLSSFSTDQVIRCLVDAAILQQGN